MQLATVIFFLLAPLAPAEEPLPRVTMFVPDADISTATLANAREVALHGEAQDRQRAMEFFSAQARKYADQNADIILKGLEDPDATVRAQAAIAFRNLKGVKESEVNDQIARLWISDGFAAAVASAYRGIANERVARELLAGLKRPSSQDQAAGAFTVLGSSGAALVRGDLVRMVDSPQEDTACTAMMVLADTKTAPPSLAPRMRERLLSGDDCYGQVVALLGSLGAVAAPAVPEIVKRINGHAGECCSWDAEHLVSIGTASVGPLLEVLKESDPYRRAWSAYALARLADQDPRARDAAIAALADPEHEVRSRVAKWL